MHATVCVPRELRERLAQRKRDSDAVVAIRGGFHRILHDLGWRSRRQVVGRAVEWRDEVVTVVWRARRPEAATGDCEDVVMVEQMRREVIEHVAGVAEAGLAQAPAAQYATTSSRQGPWRWQP